MANLWLYQSLSGASGSLVRAVWMPSVTSEKHELREITLPFVREKDKIALLSIPLSTQRHQAIFHGGIKPAGYREPTPSVCKKCAKSIKSKGSLTRHLKSCKGRKIKSRYWPSLCQRRDTRPENTPELNQPVTLSLRRPYARYVQNHTNTNKP